MSEEEKLRNLMLGALYKLGDPQIQDSLLEAWKLSNLFMIMLILIYLEQNEIPALYDHVTKKWSFQSINLSNDYTSKEEQKELEIEVMPPDVMKIFSNKKRMYFILTNVN